MGSNPHGKQDFSGFREAGRQVCLGASLPSFCAVACCRDSASNASLICLALRSARGRRRRELREVLQPVAERGRAGVQWRRLRNRGSRSRRGLYGLVGACAQKKTLRQNRIRAERAFT